MNFDLPESYTLKNANLRGLNWKYVDLLPNSPQKGTFLLVHGFPDTCDHMIRTQVDSDTLSQGSAGTLSLSSS